MENNKGHPTASQEVKCSRKTQYLASFFMLLLALMNGALIGWNSPSFLVLESQRTPLLSGPLDIEEVSWILSSFGPSSLIGTFYYIWMVNNCGRKYTAYCVAVIQLLSWLLITMATHPFYLYASKMLNGFSNSGVFIICPIFIAEISDARVRGFLGSMLGLAGNVGILLAFTFGTFMECLVVPWIFLPFGVVFIIGFGFFPETPYFHALRGKVMKAESSLRFYRGVPEEVRNDAITYELGALKNISFESAERNGRTKLKCKDFAIKSVRRSLTIGIVLCMVQQLSGCFAMMNYTASMFEDSGSSLSPNVSSIIVGLIQVLGSYLSTLLVDRVGRKILLITSAVGTGLSLSIFGTFSFFVDHPEFTDYGFIQLKSIPLITFSLAIFFANCGILNLPFLVLAEILPVKIKVIGTTLCYSVWNIMSFLVIKYLPIVMENYGMYVPVYAFSIVCFIGAIFVFFCQPETKGKTFTEILELLEK